MPHLSRSHLTSVTYTLLFLEELLYKHILLVHEADDFVDFTSEYIAVKLHNLERAHGDDDRLV